MRFHILFFVVLVFANCFTGNSTASENLNQNLNGTIPAVDTVTDESSTAQTQAAAGGEDTNITNTLSANSSNENASDTNAIGRANFQKLGDKANKIVAYNWETGEELTKDMLKEKQLYVRAKSGLLTFNAQKNGITQPIQLPFNLVDEKPMCQSEFGKWLQLSLKICLRKGMSCKNGCAICYVGQMDPANRPSLLDHLHVPNLPNPEQLNLCKNDGLKGWERKILHAVFLKASGEGDIKQIELSSSFSAEKQTLDLDEKNCATLKITIDDTNGLDKPGNVWTHLAQAGNLAELPIQKILPFDMFSNFGEIVGDYTKKKPLLAFAGSEGCGLEISIDSDVQPLLHCSSKKCDNTITPIDPDKPRVWPYEDRFETLKPATTKEQVPKESADNVLFGKDKNGKPWIHIAGKGEEVVFGVLTKGSEPPKFTVPYPPNGEACTVLGNKIVNTFLLAFNGNQRCNVEIMWGKNALFMISDNLFEESVNGRKDVAVNVVNTKRGTASFHAKDINNVESNCRMRSSDLEKPFDGFPGHTFLWEFILNPEQIVDEKGIVPSYCYLGVAFHSDEYVVLFPHLEDLNNDEED